LSDADRRLSSPDLSTWPIDRLEAHAATLQNLHHELETVTVVAQYHVYRSAEPWEVRLRWATLALNANHRMHGDSPWDQARMLYQDFMLRAWIIEHLGPGSDPAWDHETLAADTLAALTLDPAQAGATATDWRDLPIEQIRELRRHKNLTAHLDRLINHLQPGPAKERLIVWIEVREHLP
jgi:hypothetical protein